MAIKLVSVNIEGEKHLKTVGELLVREQPDVVCLMEVKQEDLQGLVGEMYPYRRYAPSVRLARGGTIGVGLATKHEIVRQEIYYCGEYVADNLPLLGRGSHAPTILLTEIAVGKIRFAIGVVHFSWTAGGGIDERQRRHLRKLLEWSERQGEFILAGDFNIPRGNEMYRQIAGKLRDNIPADIKTTIDPDLHYANQVERGKLALVVDYAWSTPGYRVDKVRVECGVSDHCAVVCHISLV